MASAGDEQEANLGGIKGDLERKRGHGGSMEDGLAKEKKEEMTREGPEGGNSDQQLILHAASKESQDEQEDVEKYTFEEGEVKEELKNKWMVIARYYSGQRYNVQGMFAELSVAWGLRQPAAACSIAENKFLIEFDSENMFNRVTRGGHGTTREMPSL